MKLLIFIFFLALAACQSITINVGCKQYANDSMTCLTCSQRFYKDAKGLCQPVSTQCNNYDNSTGACTSCYDGYTLIEVICIPSSNPQDPNCANFSKGACNKCSRGFYLQSNICNGVDPLCKTFDYSSLLCTECYQGFNLVNNTCALKPAETVSPGCASYNNSVCVKCSKNFYMSQSQGICKKVDSKCKTFNQADGKCLSCFDGWTLANGSCIIQDTTTIDANCFKFENQICVNCSFGYYFNKNNICTQIDPFCKNFNFTSLTCVACFSGFILTNGRCDFNPDKPIYDLNCKSFDKNGKCLNCSKGYYFDSINVCRQLDPNCKTYSQENYTCSACYSGYTLVNESCLINPKSTLIGNCAKWLNGVCVKCADRAYYDINNDCLMASDLCKTFNQFNGNCTSCYVGYALSQKSGECLASTNAVCAQTDQNNICNKCIKGYYLDKSSQCIAIDTQCQTFNFVTLKCDQCYKGYNLNSFNACKLEPIISTVIPNCVSYDSNSQNCLKCYDLYYLSNNQCRSANPLCKTFDKTNGDCLSCYKDFTLTKRQCIQS